jgi:ATP-dependent DNA helicase RecG
MTDPLRLQERVQLAVSLGESHFREYKSAFAGPPNARVARDIKDVCADVARTLVAFANADGGELLVGVEDDGEITGIAKADYADGLLTAPGTHVHRDTPLPTTRTAKVELNGKVVVYFSIPKGTEYVYLTSDGRCLQRRDRESVPIPSESIVLARSERTSREYDRAFVDGASVDDLDLTLVYHVANRISKGMSAEKCLQHLELAEFDGFRFRLRRAALLLFSRKPTKWHPRSQVRLLKINGTELKSGEAYNVTADQEVTDNLLTLIETSWDLVRPYLTETRLSAGALFRTQIIYPEAACREALINAIAHRDYSIEGRGIEVHVYDDRLTIISPGSLLSSISLNDLQKQLGVHQSRNSFVARVLREIGYMRELGEGMRRIFELMKSNDLAPPDLASDNASFAITLHHRYLFSREEKLWLEKFSAFNLTREQATVVRLGYSDHVISPKEIWDSVGIVDTDAYRRLIESLIKLGIMKKTLDTRAATVQARKRKVQKKSLPRYYIVPPTTSHPDPQVSPEIAAEEVDESEYVRVFVGNIPYEVTEEDVSKVFEQFGEVSSVFIPLTYSRRNKGYAFVEFDRPEAAQKALDASGSIVLGDRRIYIQPAKPRASSVLRDAEGDHV